jgi:hypothetical protein
VKQKLALLVCLSAITMFATAALAQSVASSTCDNFKNASGAQQDMFTAFVQG